MREILLSVQPEWLVKILNGEKTIEIRKTAPKCDLPIEVYLYCAKGDLKLFKLANDEWVAAKEKDIEKFSEYNGKVVAKFTLREIECCRKNQIYNAEILTRLSCLTVKEITEYIKDSVFYAWHITDIVMLDKPIELAEFEKQCKYDKKPCVKSFKEICEKCSNFSWEAMNPPECATAGRIKLARPPQSWQYVEVKEL